MRICSIVVGRRVAVSAMTAGLLAAGPLAAGPLAAQAAPVLRSAPLTIGFRLDGRIDEAMWAAADSIGALTEIEPVAGRTPAGRTVVRVLRDADRIVIGRASCRERVCLYV